MEPDADLEVPDVPETTLHGRDGQLGQRIALLTAVLATLGAVISYQSASAQSEAMTLKNESILRQAQASDQWAYYQAKTVKSHLDRATATLATDPAAKAGFLAAQAKEDAERLGVQARAEQLQAESRRLSDEAEGKLRPHHRLALAQTFIQIGIAVAAITALSKRAWLLVGSLACAAMGIGIAASALFW